MRGTRKETIHNAQENGQGLCGVWVCVLEEKPQNEDEWNRRGSIDTGANVNARVKIQKRDVERVKVT